MARKQSKAGLKQENDGFDVRFGKFGYGTEKVKDVDNVNKCCAIVSK